MAPEKSDRKFVDGVKKVLLAGIGVASLAQEEIEDFVDKLVERGEIAEKDGRKLVDDIRERRKKEAGKLEKELDKRFSDMLTRLNIPAKSDIDSLNDKIAELNRKIDELKES